MAETCETVRIKVPATEGNPDGVVIINKADQTPEHEVVDPADALAPVAKEPAKESTAEGATKAPWAPK